MFCTECGTKMPDDAQVCPSCGAPAFGAEAQPQVEEVETAAVEVIPPVAAPVMAEPVVVEAIPAPAVAEPVAPEAPAAPAPADEIPMAIPVAQPAPVQPPQPTPQPNFVAQPTPSYSQPHTSAPAAPVPPAASAAPADVAAPGKGLAIASLICGIIAIILSWLPFINALGIVTGIASVITGIMAMKKTPAGMPGRGLAIGGLVCGIVGLLFCLMISGCYTCLIAISE